MGVYKYTISKLGIKCEGYQMLLYVIFLLVSFIEGTNAWSVELLSTFWTARVPFPAGSRRHSVQTDFMFHPNSVQFVPGLLFLDIVTGAEVKNGGALPPLPYAASLRRA
jgi:isoprenylcysteine carboxyl methyltransferase (ICMT) family protein YpbQ